LVWFSSPVPTFKGELPIEPYSWVMIPYIDGKFQ
jgi:hypothetical protein